MRKIKEVLRLKWGCDLSNRAIGRSCKVSHSTVCEYLKRAEAAGLKWPIPEDGDEERLYELLYLEDIFSPKQAAGELPVWENVHQELKEAPRNTASVVDRVS